MNYDQVVNLLTKATIKGFINWETFGTPKLHQELGLFEAYRVTFREAEIWLCATTSFWRGEDGDENQLIVFELHGIGQKGIASISTHPELLHGHKLKRRHKLMRLYLAVRRKHMQVTDQERYKREYRKARRQRFQRYFVPRNWDRNTLAKIM